LFKFSINFERCSSLVFIEELRFNSKLAKSEYVKIKTKVQIKN